MASIGTSPSFLSPVPHVRTGAINARSEEVVDVTELVRANPLFLAVAEALRLTEELARKLLRTGMDEVGTHPGNLSAEDVWFMMPRIETDVLAFFEGQDATVRRDQLKDLMKKVRYYESRKAPRAPMLQGLGYARVA
jgi:hypothetical protein